MQKDIGGYLDRLENYKYVKKIVQRDYATYSGKFLEKLKTKAQKLVQKYSAYSVEYVGYSLEDL